MSRGATARLFVAVDPPLAVREQLAVWARGAALGSDLPGNAAAERRLRLLEPRALHLTLSFLGSRPVGEIPAIDSALSACAAPVGELSVGAPLWLPARRPRALAVEIHDPTATLALLHARVTAAVAGATGWEPERRRFRAHVTVARVRDGAERTRGRRPRERSSSSGQAPLPATPQLSFTPSLLVLYRSWLSPAGATYEAICKCTLSPAGG